MKISRLLAAAIALAGAHQLPTAAEAGCDFDAVARTTPIKASMVRTFAACPSTETPTVNTETGGGTPACEPVLPRRNGLGEASTYSFGPASSCTVQSKTRILADCGGLTDGDGGSLDLEPGACHLTDVRAKCSGILRQDGTPIDGPQDDGWTLTLVTRASINDPEHGDMTVIDLPVTFAFDEPSSGSMQLASNTAVALAEIGGPLLAAMPTCTQLAFREVMVRDPQSAPFAVPGLATAPKEAIQ